MTRQQRRTSLRIPQILPLTISSIASSLLTTTFSLFHVQTFLQSYKLPLSTYATGNAIYAIFNTLNDVFGAWIIDSISDRREMVGCGGCLFALCFLTPFFRWGSSILAGAHFVISLSLYDTMYSFMAIVLGSIITDDEDMTDEERVRIMALGKFGNMVASFGIAKMGLYFFQTEDLSSFRQFLIFLSVVVSVLFLSAQKMLISSTQPFKNSAVMKDQDGTTNSDNESKPPRKRLNLLQVIRDFSRHKKFRYWILMEMLLESQCNFASNFSKTFVDHLLFGPFSRSTCDFLLSSVRPLSQIMGLMFYIPIRRFGYCRIYTWVFRIKLFFSILLFVFGSPSTPTWIAIFLVLHSILSNAILSSGFHLAMSDMVQEMKLNQAKENRFDEASLAGLFMGVNALFCKPMDSFLPIVAAYWLEGTGFGEYSNEVVKWRLFCLMVVPPLVFSAVQLGVWGGYSLDQRKVEDVRMELKKLREEYRHGGDNDPKI